MMKTSQTTSISSQTTSNQPLKPDLFLPNHIVHLPNHICYLSNHINYLSNQIVLLPNQIIPLSNQIMMWFGRFSGCRKCSRSNRKGNFQKRKLPVISVSPKLPIRQQSQNYSRLPLSRDKPFKPVQPVLNLGTKTYLNLGTKQESKILDFGYIGRFSANLYLLTLKRSNFAHFRARGLIFCYWSYIYHILAL